MRFFLLIIISVFSQFLYSQYSTPGTGVVWNMDSLVANSDGAVTFENLEYYRITSEIHISENDSLIIVGANITVDPNYVIYVEGSIHMDGVASTIDGGIVNTLPFGMRLEENSRDSS